jgi:hypothetical protein
MDKAALNPNLHRQPAGAPAPATALPERHRDMPPSRPGAPALTLPVLAVAAAAAAGACAPLGPPPPSVALPSDAVVGAGDPTRAAIINTAYAFGSPGVLAGRPDEAARAAANFEFIAVEIPYGPRYRGLNAILQPELEAGRAELRSVLGIRPDAPPQAVIDGLYAASRALRAGDTAAADRILSSPVFAAGGQATLQRLAALPPMPRVNVAATHTQQELDRSDRMDRQRGGGGVGGRT